MDSVIYKTKISISYIFRALVIFLIIAILAAYKSNGDFLKLTLIIYGCSLLFIFSFDLFFKSSIALTDKFIIINYSPFLFFFKPKQYELKDIQNIVFYYLRGKGVVPNMVIDFKSGVNKKRFSFFLISHKSVIELSEHIKGKSISMEIIDNVLNLKK